jgi:hypothetical protein
MTNIRSKEEEFLEKVENDWKIDGVIDKENLVEECYKAPSLHSKYLNYFNHVKRQHIKVVNLYRKMYWEKKSTINENKDRKTDPKDVKPCLEADDELQKLNERVQIIELTIKTLEGIMTSIAFRTSTVKTIIDVRKFMEGVN